MASNLNKALIVVGSLALIGLLLFAALIALVVVGDNRAKARALALCAPDLVGVPTDTALDRARTSGAANTELRWRREDGGSDELMVAFPAALPLTGYLCWIRAKDGVVTSTEITTVD